MQELTTKEYEQFNIEECLDILDTVSRLSLFDLYDKLIITEEDIEIINKDKSNVPPEIMEKVYSFCYNNGLFINDIIWLEQKELGDDESLLLSHGSRANIKGNIRLDVSGDSNDFSDGFYCGENLKQAGMFVSNEPDSSMYIIEFNPIGLLMKKFNVSTDWMLAVAYYRETIDEYKNSDRIQSLIASIDECDFVVAPIADNRMFQIIDAFTDNQITDVQCRHALSATNLGYQFVMKNKNTLDNIKILKHLYLCNAEKNRYNIIGQEESNTSLNKAILAKKKFSGEGKYINQII